MAVGDEEKRELLYAAGEHRNYSGHQEITVKVPQKKQNETSNMYNKSNR